MNEGRESVSFRLIGVRADGSNREICRGIDTENSAETLRDVLVAIGAYAKVEVVREVSIQTTRASVKNSLNLTEGKLYLLDSGEFVRLVRFVNQVRNRQVEISPPIKRGKTSCTYLMLNNFKKRVVAEA